MTDAPDGVPELDELAGDWIDRGDLAHLPSLRNQWGQAHVNEDLASLSWLAMPPYSVGYHTGALRLDGRVLRASRFRWSPWGVRRAAEEAGLSVESEVRLGYEDSTVFWRHSLTNPGAESVTVTVEQELLAMAAHSEVDWGWLYGTPWNAGHHHDFYVTERIRREVTEARPRQVNLLPEGERWVRLGRPRLPGIQRDEDEAPMLLETLLPDHTSPDSGRIRLPGIEGRLRRLETAAGAGEWSPIGTADGEYRIGAMTEERIALLDLGDGAAVRFEAMVEVAGQTGALLTHGNHPDSLQIGLENGTIWLNVGGERIVAADPFPPGEWHGVEVRVDARCATLLVDGVVVGETRPWWDGQRWTATERPGAVLIEDARSIARAAYAFSTPPTSIRVEGARAFAGWDVTVPAGGTVAWGVQLTIGADAAEVVRDAGSAARLFDDRFAAIADRWRDTWVDAFTPGNPEFSGYLPTLHSDDPDLSRTYYLGALLAIYMRSTRVSPLGPVFLTGGPRLGATTTFYWDQSEWARTAALLEPVGIRAWFLAALAQPYESSHSFDTRNLLPIGNHYAANDHSLFRTIQAYVGITGDRGVLEEIVRGRSVLDHLRAMAYRPRRTRAAFGAGVLVDFGADAWELLECVPNYRDAVVSFNAGYVGMLRDLALLLRLLGEGEEAALAEADADALASAVLGQYAGGGRWMIAHPTGDDVIGHCLDFELVAAEMAEDLSAAQKREMVEFVATHLIDGNWMRALSPDDPIAPLSDRPDHGAAGAFAAWPGATAYGLCRLGRPDIATGLLRRAHLSTSEGLWGQAMEAIGSGRYRVAERGVSNRESNAAVAVTEAVIAGLFSIEAGFASLERTEGSLEASAGTLSNVRAIGFDLSRGTAVPPEPVEARGA